MSNSSSSGGFDWQAQVVPFGAGFVVGYVGKWVGRVFFWGGLAAFGGYQVARHKGWCGEIDVSDHVNTARSLADANGDGKIDMQDAWAWIDRGAERAGVKIPEGSKSGPFAIGLVAGIWFG